MGEETFKLVQHPLLLHEEFSRSVGKQCNVTTFRSTERMSSKVPMERRIAKYIPVIIGK